MSEPQPEKAQDVKQSIEIHPQWSLHTDSVIGQLLQVAGVLTLLIGGGTGIYWAAQERWEIGIPILASTVVLCLLFFSLWEIIRLLERIVQNKSK